MTDTLKQQISCPDFRASASTGGISPANWKEIEVREQPIDSIHHLEEVDAAIAAEGNAMMADGSDARDSN